MEPQSAQQMVAAAKSKISSLTCDEVEAELGTALIVDVREVGELAENGMIPGAIHVPRGLLEFWADPASPAHREELNPSQRTILYCAVGGRSALSAMTLQHLGFRDVAHLDSGYQGWKAAGKAITAPEA